MRPHIGVTVSRRSGWRIFPLMWLSVRLAGGRAFRWDEADDADLDSVDGVVIGGGDDISPFLYGGELDVSARLDPDRDRMEKGVVEGAYNRGLPILGICRGSQMLNVVLGGTLHQNAYDTFGGSTYVKTILPKKRIDVVAGTRRAAVAGDAPMRINALHSQAVDRVGEGLRVAARDDGGMIQAVERVADPFALGVQWHPEHLFYARRQRRLFRALVEAARARRARGKQLAAVDAEVPRIDDGIV